ncbi:unnamed protein product [Blepharisma stoltei]|uniref:Uncharacterized protein n=1 Tax=Blepharisma stoltei TaxID=1481888 RepID=A0AAU9K1M7_9CILI|nr:unnamed protein product [Blepharisma stoltei]
MNILSIESKFQELDKKDKHARLYYNPKAAKGFKHQYISDIRADFQHDTLLYGLGLFWNQEFDNEGPATEENIPEAPQEEPSKQVKKDSEPKPDIIAKRKNQKLLDIQKPLAKDDYQGIFSNTKVLNHDYLYKRPQLENRTAGWKTTGDQDITVVNKAAQGSINNPKKTSIEDLKSKIDKYRSDYKGKPNKKMQEGLTQDEFKTMMDDHQRFLKENKGADRNFQLSPTTLRKLNTSNSFIQSRTPEPAFELKLSAIDSYEGISDRNLSFIEGSENKSFEKPSSSNNTDRPYRIQSMKPITMERLSEKSPKKGKIQIQLPPIIKNQKPSKANSNKPIANPLTHALYAYKQNLDAFHPHAYPANLSIFETHDFIEQRYFRSYLKNKKAVEEPEVLLGVHGKPVLM